MKKALLAALFNLLFTGTGYLYLGVKQIFGWLLVLSEIVSTLIIVFQPEKLDIFYKDIWGWILVSIVGIAFATDAFYEGRKLNKNAVKAVGKETKKKKENKYARRSFLGLIILLLDLIFFFIMCTVSIFYPSGEIWDKTVIIVILAMLFSPLFLLILQKLSFKALTFFSIAGGIMLLISIGGLFAAAAQQPTQIVADTNGKAFTNKELFDAVNKERAKNRLPELIVESSSCAIAKIRLEDITKNGVANYSNPAAFQRSIDKAFKADPSLKQKKTPNWYQDFLTYEASVDESIAMWKDSEAKILFTKKEFKYGCAAIKDGYGIVLVGFDEDQPKEDLFEQDSQEQIKFLDTRST